MTNDQISDNLFGNRHFTLRNSVGVIMKNVVYSLKKIDYVT